MMDKQEQYTFFHDPLKYYNAMLGDIALAQNYIYLETYRFNNDSIGVKFKDALVKKAKQGVEVKILVDSWGTSLPTSFFAELKEHGGEVRFFQKIKLLWDFFTRNHKRNHRKLLLVDDEITYIGSANITDYSLNWRESVLRLSSDITPKFKKVFLQHFEMYNRDLLEKIPIRKISHGGFEILRDVPSMTRQRIRKKFIEMIKQAKTKVVIQTPYFLPSKMIRKALSDAVRRGVNVKVIMPRNSDVGLVDVLRTRILGPLYKNGVEQLFYEPHNLHSKLLLVDDTVFAVGSPNFDYRSFRFQHEIVLVGNEPAISEQISKHIKDTLEDCTSFNYEKWLKRSALHKFFEWLILPVRHLL